jgi:hypothetical protein
VTLTVEEQVVPRVRVRRRRSVLQLRQPEAAYGPVAVGLLFATGLMGMLFAETGLAGAEATSAGVLAVPAGVASLVTAAAIGHRMRRLKERSQTNLVLRVSLIWTFFGAVWPLLQIIPAVTHGDIADVVALGETVAAMGVDALAGAAAGALGGLCGGAAAAALCIERVR